MPAKKGTYAKLMTVERRVIKKIIDEHYVPREDGWRYYEAHWNDERVFTVFEERMIFLGLEVRPLLKVRHVAHYRKSEEFGPHGFVKDARDAEALQTEEGANKTDEVPPVVTVDLTGIEKTLETLVADVAEIKGMLKALVQSPVTTIPLDKLLTRIREMDRRPPFTVTPTTLTPIGPTLLSGLGKPPPL